jgi:hypothetical protein
MSGWTPTSTSEGSIRLGGEGVRAQGPSNHRATPGRIYSPTLTPTVCPACPPGPAILPGQQHYGCSSVPSRTRAEGGFSKPHGEHSMFS